MDSKEYIDLLLKNSKEEDDIYALVEEENKRFENTKECLEHREVVDGYLKKIHELFTKRMDTREKINYMMQQPEEIQHHGQH